MENKRLMKIIKSQNTHMQIDTAERIIKMMNIEAVEDKLKIYLQMDDITMMPKSSKHAVQWMLDTEKEDNVIDMDKFLIRESDIKRILNNDIDINKLSAEFTENIILTKDFTLNLFNQELSFTSDPNEEPFDVSNGGLELFKKELPNIQNLHEIMEAIFNDADKTELFELALGDIVNFVDDSSLEDTLECIADGTTKLLGDSEDLGALLSDTDICGRIDPCVITCITEVASLYNLSSAFVKEITDNIDNITLYNDKIIVNE